MKMTELYKFMNENGADHSFARYWEVVDANEEISFGARKDRELDEEDMALYICEDEPRPEKEDKKLENKQELVKVENEQIVTDSRQVAEHFEKQHKHVLDAIENIKAENSAVTSMFYETAYKAGTGKNYKMYYMNRDGFTLLAMGFTGKKALEWKLKYINAFNEMENKLKQMAKQPSYQIADEVARAKRWIEEAEERKALLATTEKQAQVIGELKPKADYVDRILQSKSLVNITQIAKDYGMSGMAMNAKLHELGIQYKAGKQWLLYSKYHALGYTSSKTIEFTRRDGTPDVNMQTAWTQKGRLFLYEKLKKAGVLPMIEWKESEKEVS